MGYRSFDSTDWTAYTAASATYTSAKSIHDVFKGNDIDPSLDPAKFTMRESRNSAANPRATPLIYALDLTGSMGSIAREIAQEGLGVLIKETYDRKPVTNPHIMFAGIGDVDHDRVVLQASQFEADIKILQELMKLCLTKSGGGGNSWESYNAIWHLAAFHTSCDAFEKDNRKGFIFTFGDELVPPDLNAERLKRIYGREDETVATNAQLLALLAHKYHVFHLMIAGGSYMRGNANGVRDSWQNLLGQNAIEVPVGEHKRLSEIIVSTMQIVAGDDADVVAKSWSGDTSLVVAQATGHLKTMNPTASADSSSAVTRL